MAEKNDVTAEAETATAEVERSQSAGVTDVAAAIAGLNDSSAAFYTTIKGTDFAARKLIAAAQTKSKPLADSLNQQIDLTNFIVQSVSLQDENTGEITDAPRVTLIAADGVAYHATSTGLLSALRNIIATLGEPDSWPEPLPVKVVEQRGRKGFRFMTIELV